VIWIGTAATRSLLNTARLMDENPTLLRLKSSSDEKLEPDRKVGLFFGRIVRWRRRRLRVEIGVRVV
jgi:hypothetical protein